MTQQGIPRAIEFRRRQLSQVEDLAGGYFRVSSVTELTGVGEGIFQVEFPVAFMERPSFTTGWELTENQALVQGSYPECSIGIFRWSISYRRDNGMRSWRGASLLAKTRGPDSQIATLNIIADTQFVGRTLLPGT